jgi:shikimate kinase
MDRHVILVGLPGSGKSTVAPLVADALGLPFVDVDGVIVRRMGMPVDRIFGEFGEARFRELEREAMAGLLDGPASVLAPGGGWAAQAGSLEAATPRSLIVYLKVPPATALARALEGTERPLLAGGEGMARMTALLGEREARYQLADLTVENHGDDPAVAATEIVGWIRRVGFA